MVVIMPFILPFGFALDGARRHFGAEVDARRQVVETPAGRGAASCRGVSLGAENVQEDRRGLF